MPGTPAISPKRPATQSCFAWSILSFDEDTKFHHMWRGDFTPYVARSRDRGKTWESISGDLPARHVVWSIKEDHVARDLPFGRFGRADEVGDVVAFLASSRASWISGACVTVDGCQSRSNI